MLRAFLYADGACPSRVKHNLLILVQRAVADHFQTKKTAERRHAAWLNAFSDRFNFFLGGKADVFRTKHRFYFGALL